MFAGWYIEKVFSDFSKNVAMRNAKVVISTHMMMDCKGMSLLTNDFLNLRVAYIFTTYMNGNLVPIPFLVSERFYIIS